MQFPRELWVIIKDYVFDYKKYWKYKMNKCLYNKAKTIWVSGMPIKTYKECILSYSCNLSIQGIIIRNGMDKYKKYGKTLCNNRKYEVITSIK